MKKDLILVICLFIVCMFIFTACEQENSRFLNKESENNVRMINDGSSIVYRLKVRNSKTEFNFEDILSKEYFGSTCKDSVGKKVDLKSVELNEGDNFFYITINGKEKKFNIYRYKMYHIIFEKDKSVIAEYDIEEGQPIKNNVPKIMFQDTVWKYKHKQEERNSKNNFKLEIKEYEHVLSMDLYPPHDILAY